MKITLTDKERRMLLEAAKSFREADRDCISMYDDGTTPTCGYGNIDKKLIREWNLLIKKLRKPVRHA